jgi:ATP-dependent Lhr-like helicase
VGGPTPRWPPNSAEVVGRQIERLRVADQSRIVPEVAEAALEGLKFSECLPPEIATEIVRVRLSDEQGVAGVLARSTRVVIAT